MLSFNRHYNFIDPISINILFYSFTSSYSFYKKLSLTIKINEQY